MVKGGDRFFIMGWSRFQNYFVWPPHIFIWPPQVGMANSEYGETKNLCILLQLQVTLKSKQYNIIYYKIRVCHTKSLLFYTHLHGYGTGNYWLLSCGHPWSPHSLWPPLATSFALATPFTLATHGHSLGPTSKNI